MSSFFHSIQSYFKAEYHGRYLSLMLKEIAQHEPQSMMDIIRTASKKASNPSSTNQIFWRDMLKGLKHGEFTFTCEEHFRSGTRRADLAFLHGKSPRLLFEVKEYDHKNSDNDEQISDYLKTISEKKNLGLIFVYRFNPEREYFLRLLRRERKGKKPVATIGYTEIYVVLRSKRRPLADLLCNYLEDIGVGVYQRLNLAADDRQGRSLLFLFIQMLGISEYHGNRQLQSDEAARIMPELIETLFANVEFIGECMRRSNRSLFPKRFWRRFFIEPTFYEEDLYIDLEAKKRNDVGKLPYRGIENYTDGGTIRFCAWSSLSIGDGRYYRIYLGYQFEIARGQRPPIKAAVFSG